MHTMESSEQIALGRDNVIHLGLDLDIAELAVSDAFWSHVPTRHPQLSHGRILSVGDYTATWPYWERHPVGDELVYLVSGDAEFVVATDDECRTIRLAVGEAAIVPAGAWHRAVIHAPSRLLFITPTPARTDQRPVSPEDEQR